MRQSPQAPLFLGGSPSKIAYTVLNLLQMFDQRTIPGEDFFFFLEDTMSFGEKYASQDQTSFFSQTTLIFEISCLGPYKISTTDFK